MLGRINEEYINSETESISSEEIIEEELKINITGQIEIINNKVIIKINKDGKNNKLIENINKELEILEELKSTYKRNKDIKNNKIYKREIELLKSEIENKYEEEIIKYKNKLCVIESNIKEYYETKIKILEEKIKDKEERYEDKVNILEEKIKYIK